MDWVGLGRAGRVGVGAGAGLGWAGRGGAGQGGGGGVELGLGVGWVGLGWAGRGGVGLGWAGQGRVPVEVGVEVGVVPFLPSVIQFLLLLRQLTLHISVYTLACDSTRKVHPRAPGHILASQNHPMQ